MNNTKVATNAETIKELVSGRSHYHLNYTRSGGERVYRYYYRVDGKVYVKSVWGINSPTIRYYAK